MGLAVDLDDRRFGAAFRQVGEVIVGALTGAREVVERGVDGLVAAARQAVVDQLYQTALPELVFQPAA